MKNVFTEHPHSIGESYFQHFRFATCFGMKMIVGGFACLLHAIFPFIFKKTGSDLLLKMTHDFVERMPNVEGRIEVLSQCIESKKENCRK